MDMLKLVRYVENKYLDETFWYNERSLTELLGILDYRYVGDRNTRCIFTLYEDKKYEKECKIKEFEGNSKYLYKHVAFTSALGGIKLLNYTDSRWTEVLGIRGSGNEGYGIIYALDKSKANDERFFVRLCNGYCFRMDPGEDGMHWFVKNIATSKGVETISLKSYNADYMDTRYGIIEFSGPFINGEFPTRRVLKDSEFGLAIVKILLQHYDKIDKFNRSLS